MLASMLHELVSRWGYLAIALATFIEGEIVLIWAGALAHEGLLSLPLVALAATVGSLAWGQTWFYTGKLLGRAFIDRRPKWRARVASVEPLIARYGGWSVVAFRFIAGMAIVLPLFIGASGFPRKRFFILDGIGASIWASGFACTGFALGTGLGKILGRAISWPELVGIALAGAFTIWLITQLLRALIAKRTGRGTHQATP
jgi:membrane protein DedA with SNARE-associated domain